MTSLTRTPAALAAYLRRATWGLPRARQQELWDELEEHVLTRADHLCGLGADPEQALSQALRELGPPARVSAGMTQVYLMPKMILTAAAAALALSAALYAAAGGSEGAITLPVLTNGLTKPSCVRGTVPSETVVTVISRSQQDGITCYVSKRPLNIQLPPLRGAFLSEDTLSKVAERLGGRGAVDANGFFIYSRGGSMLASVRTVGFKDGVRYFPVSLLATLFPDRNIALAGFDRPTITADGVSIALGTEGQRLGSDFYRGLTMSFVEQLVSAAETRVDAQASGFSHRIQTKLAAGEVVMLLNKVGGIYSAAYGQVGQNGVLNVRAFAPRLGFTTDPALLGTPVKQGVLRALLVRVTNVPLRNLKQGIFLPPQATSDAAR